MPRIKNTDMRHVSVRGSSKRGAALILEIIIYLVIVSLIAVAVTSGVRALRDLVFTSHAKGDIQNVQAWAEIKYAQDGVYPNSSGAYFTDPTLQLTTVGADTNETKINSINGANSGYCIMVRSSTITPGPKRWFWVSSAYPGRIMQGGTATANGGSSTTVPDSGIPGVTCP